MTYFRLIQGRLIIARAVVVGLVFFSGVVQALQDVDLYSVQVPVNSADPNGEAHAMRTALGLVLIKLTGLRDAPSHAGAALILDKTQRYIKQYSYVDAASTPGTSAATQLKISFDASALEVALQAAALPIWDVIRPTLIVWLGIEDSEDRRLIGSDDYAGYSTIIKAHGVRRALPVVMPLLDLEDTANIQISDVWGDFKEPIEIASQRYGADVILLGRVALSVPGTWQANWVLYENAAEQGEQRSEFATSGTELNAVLGEGVDMAADFLAARHLGDASAGAGATMDLPVAEFPDDALAVPSNVLKITVVGISGVDDYARVNRFLENVQESMQNGAPFEVLRTEDDRIYFSLGIDRMDAETYRKALGFSGVLQMLDDTPGKYRMIPP